MPKSRVKWVLALLALVIITFACSKKEEGTQTQQGVKQETPAEQQKTMTGETKEPAAGMSSQGEEQKAASAQPGEEQMAASEQGKEIYQQSCASCHESGVAGAPKVGDTEAWSSRLAKGEEALVQSAVNGIGSMPPKGGASSLSEDDVRAAVLYMMEQSR